MAIIITDECIIVVLVTNVPIQRFTGADDWRYEDGTDLKGDAVLPNGTAVDAEEVRFPCPMNSI